MTRPLKFYTAAEAAQVLHVKPFEVSRLCRSGAIAASKPGLKWLIAEADLLAYIEASSNQQVPA